MGLERQSDPGKLKRADEVRRRIERSVVKCGCVRVPARAQYVLLSRFRADPVDREEHKII